MTSPLWVYLIGFIGMALYGVRLFVQWYMSEKAHKVVSPGIYWVMSSIGAVVLYLYGWLRKDFSIIFGETCPRLRTVSCTTRTCRRSCCFTECWGSLHTRYARSIS